MSKIEHFLLVEQGRPGDRHTGLCFSILWFS